MPEKTPAEEAQERAEIAEANAREAQANRETSEAHNPTEQEPAEHEGDGGSGGD